MLRGLYPHDAGVDPADGIEHGAQGAPAFYGNLHAIEDAVVSYVGDQAAVGGVNACEEAVGLVVSDGEVDSAIISRVVAFSGADGAVHPLEGSPQALFILGEKRGDLEVGERVQLRRREQHPEAHRGAG